jgi:hypothetical protein
VVLDPDPDGVPLHPPGPTFAATLAQSIGWGALR